MALTPVTRYVDAAAYPDALVPLHMVQETLQAGKTPRPAHQATVQTDRHHLGRMLALGIQHVEGILEISVKVVARVEALRCSKAHVVAIQGIGYDQLRFG